MAGLVAHLMMESMLRAMLQAIESISIIIMNSLPLLTVELQSCIKGENRKRIVIACTEGRNESKYSECVCMVKIERWGFWPFLRSRKTIDTIN